jgi:inhibitor of KinA
MIAGTHAIIQPFPGPTGWRVVGRTPHTIVDISRPAPVSFGIGDVVRFVPVTKDEATASAGSFLLPTEVPA